MKTFFGGIFIEKEKLLEAGINYPIKLEYYKNINEDEIIKKKNPRFGISVVKTEYMKEKSNVEVKNVNFLSDDEVKIDRILALFRKNEVTPIQVEDIICDFGKALF